MPLFESSAVCLDKKRKTLRGMNEPSKVMKRCFFSTSVRLLEKKKKIFLIGTAGIKYKIDFIESPLRIFLNKRLTDEAGRNLYNTASELMLLGAHRLRGVRECM